MKNIFLKTVLLLLALTMILSAFASCSELEGESGKESVAGAENEEDEKSSKGTKATNDISLLYNESEDETLIIDGDSVYEKIIDGEAFLRQTSVDGEVVLIEDEDDTIYIFDGELKRIADDVDGAMLSDNGSSVVYADDEDVLFFYDGGESKKILADASSMSSLAISPDGKCVAYVDDGDLKLYDGDSKRVVEDVKRVYGVSNGAKLIYYVDENNSLRVLKGDENIKLGEVGGAVFNADLTQILFACGDDCYISQNGAEKVKISETGILSFVSYGKIVNSSLPVKTFGNMYFLDNEDTLWYMDGDFDVAKVKDGVKSCFVAKTNSKVVYYLDDNNRLHRGDEGYNSEFVRVGKNVQAYFITSDGDACYYVDEDDKLFYAKGEEEPVKISGYIDEIVMTHDDYVIFGVANEGIYYSRNGSEKKNIKISINKDDSIELEAGYVSTYLAILDEETDTKYIYAAKSGVEFKLIAQANGENDF